MAGRKQKTGELRAAGLRANSANDTEEEQRRCAVLRKKYP
jgi:hypothetical protein